MLPSDYERVLKEEIWGCFKYIGIPIDVVMSLPIQDRRFYIQKHNAEQENASKPPNGSKNGSGNYTNNGDLNMYASLEQQNAKNR